jgi:hypothetical protein
MADETITMSNSKYRALLNRVHAAEDKLTLLTAERDGLGSKLLDVQQDCINALAREKRLRDLCAEALDWMSSVGSESEWYKRLCARLEKASKR